MSTPASLPEGSAFNIPSDLLLIGRVIARGSPGITVYDADMRVGTRTTKVHLLLLLLAVFTLPVGESAKLDHC